MYRCNACAAGTMDNSDQELSGIAFFAGLFIYVVFISISKAPLEPTGDPLLKESEKFVC